MTGALNTILTDPPYGDGVDEAKVSQLWSTLTMPMLTTLIKFNSARTLQLRLSYSSSTLHAQLIFQT